MGAVALTREVGFVVVVVGVFGVVASVAVEMATEIGVEVMAVKLNAVVGRVSALVGVMSVELATVVRVAGVVAGFSPTEVEMLAGLVVVVAELIA